LNTIPPNPLAIIQLAICRKPSRAFTGKISGYLVEGETSTGENAALKSDFLDHASPFALRSVESLFDGLRLATGAGIVPHGEFVNLCGDIAGEYVVVLAEVRELGFPVVAPDAEACRVEFGVEPCGDQGGKGGVFSFHILDLV
jgi:hypothetical protein